MRLHAVLPNESPAVDPQRIVHLAVLAEQLGFDAVWVPDHLLPPGEYGRTYGGVHEPLILLTAIAAATSRIHLGTSVLVLPMRSPFVVAKQVATLDRVSGGRTELGVGIGWDAVEFGNVGSDFATRAPRLDEGLRLLRHLFDDGRGPFRGDHYGFDSGVFEPRPARRIPITVGGNSPAALRRAAGLGDAWQSVFIGPEDFASRRAKLDEHAGDRFPAGARADWQTESGLAGLVGRAHEFEAAGADYLAVSFGEVDGWDDRLSRFAEARPTGG